jgi:hypothetical protein
MHTMEWYNKVGMRMGQGEGLGKILQQGMGQEKMVSIDLV